MTFPVPGNPPGTLPVTCITGQCKLLYILQACRFSPFRQACSIALVAQGIEQQVSTLRGAGSNPAEGASPCSPMAETNDLNSLQCGFESHYGHDMAKD